MSRVWARAWLGVVVGATRSWWSVLAGVTLAAVGLVPAGGATPAAAVPVRVEAASAQVAGFTDVPGSHPFVAEISWLASAGISTGYADGTFHPVEAVSRQAMAAFLYRYAGRPPYTPPVTARFADVPTSHAFYAEISWLAEQGITTGYADGSFHPAEAVSRQAMAAFLYRYAHLPAFTAPATPTFGDVPASAGFFTEVEWLASTGITTGYADHTFHPVEDVSRQAMAAFLFRYDTNPTIGAQLVTPGPVTDLGVLAADTTSVSLGWANSRAEGFTGVVIRRVEGSTAPASPSDGDPGVVTTGPVNQWTDTGLTPGGTYSYAVFAQYADAPQMPATTITVTVAAMPSLTGTVTGSGAVPVPGVEVEVTGTVEAAVTTHATTAADGRYEVAGLAAGDYTVCFVPAGVTQGAPTGYLRQCFDQVDVGGAPVPVTVVGAVTTTGIDAALATAASVSGTVTNTDGSPVPGVVVDVEQPGGQPVGFATTDSTGTWTITGLDPGTYGVCFDPADADITYLAQCYDTVAPSSVPTEVAVAAHTATTGIDATLETVAPLAPARVSPGLAATTAASPAADTEAAFLAAAASTTPSTNLALVACADVLFLGARGSGQTGPGGGKQNPTDQNAGLGGEVYTAYTQFKTALGTSHTVTPPIALSYRADSIRSILTLRFIQDMWQGVLEARRALRARNTQCPNERIVLAGFSQGAMLMHRILTNATTKNIPSMNRSILARVDATILIADGDRVAHDTAQTLGTAKPTAQGVGTQLDTTINVPKLAAATGARTFSVCDDRDAVCDFRVPYLFAPGSLGSDAFGAYVHTHHYNQSAIVRQAAAAAANLIRTVPPALAFTTTDPLPTATVGVPYSVTFAATGGTPPYSFGFASTPPNNGLDTFANGTWSGTPTTTGTYPITITVTDALGATTTKTFHLTITDTGSGGRSTSLVSAAPDGTPANSSSEQPSISGDGRWITYYSAASDLVPEDTSGFYDVFVMDRTTGVTTLVSKATDGTPTDGGSYFGSVSADGRWITYSSDASNLVPGDTNAAWDVFVTDRTTGLTTLVSAAPDGTPANDYSFDPSVSADGRWITYNSDASNLVPGDTNGMRDVFVTDRTTGVTTMVSRAPDGTPGNGMSDVAAISADGRWITYDSDASNLVPVDFHGQTDVFVTDRTTGATTLVSKASDGTQGFSLSDTPSVSADGRWITYTSVASNLVPGDINGRTDVFVTDRTTGATTLVSRATDGTQGNRTSGNSVVSADGRWITYSSDASNLVPGDTNAAWDVFVTDRTTGVTTLLSRATDGTQGNGASDVPAISADGRWITYCSYASNLVPGDTNTTYDVFVTANPGMP